MNKLFEEPSDQDDEFENPEERQTAYQKAVHRLGAEHEERMRDKHGDLR